MTSKSSAHNYRICRSKAPLSSVMVQFNASGYQILQVLDLLKLYNDINFPPQRLLFKIPSTWQLSNRLNWICYNASK